MREKFLHREGGQKYERENFEQNEAEAKRSSKFDVMPEIRGRNQENYEDYHLRRAYGEESDELDRNKTKYERRNTTNHFSDFP